ncbi:conserved hypothetical protein [Verticillium alfalfae VaMs.102]|uniref:Uncharacterized protein n=1 Tax=Verticillium alfalfae (strain VaMs.102 / ATCC MYA-4576 / FGSC 10136) TaxID=526221 RepID=C9SIC0_VERA1|nr:conserved hypothetical protein [Verticillium alfalfae VaMs.102]EEY18693.1 conserved hypothetical protein [Verticillium alfalfae VaMs.102]
MAHRETQTYSHSLAKADVLAVTAAAPSDDGSVFDLGWNQKPEHDAKPWIKGMHNENVWEVYELKKTDHVPYGGLDLVVARDSECSPNKLRSEVERLYMGMTYFAAWTLDCLMPLLTVATIALVVSPRARVVLFPPAPLSMVDMTTGGVAKPMAGTLGSTDAATGAPQNLKGEAAENEASNFVTRAAAIATNLVMGQDHHGAPFESSSHSGTRAKPSSTIFRGVPTNLQLALTLLRLGEANQAPFPPPARVHQPPPDEPIDIDQTVIDASVGDQPLGVSADELQHTAGYDAAQADHAGGGDTEVEQAVGHGNKRERVLSILKGSAKEAVKAAAGVDKIRAKMGATHAKQRVGVLPPVKKEKQEK